MHKQLILYQINKILLNTCVPCEMRLQLNRDHGNTYSKIDGFCNQYCNIGKRLQELGNQYRKEIRPRKQEANTMDAEQIHMYVLVSKNAHGSWTEYYGGKTYIHQGETWAAFVQRNDAKRYFSKRRAENAAESLGNKVGYTFIAEEY